METAIFGKKIKNGVAPAIALCNPKFPRNVGAAIRAASCFGIKQVWFTGNRVKLDGKERLPREERMKGYGEVELRQHDYFFDCFNRGVTPVAVELIQGSEMLPQFVHPENPLYVFGPEDGSISQVFRRLCHRHVVIPTRHCTNLAAAIYIILYDRLLKQQQNGAVVEHNFLAESRGLYSPHDPLFAEEGEIG